MSDNHWLTGPHKVPAETSLCWVSSPRHRRWLFPLSLSSECILFFCFLCVSFWRRWAWNTPLSLVLPCPHGAARHDECGKPVLCCRDLLQVIFQTPGPNPGLLHCMQILYRMWGLPKKKKKKPSDFIKPCGAWYLRTKCCDLNCVLSQSHILKPWPRGPQNVTMCGNRAFKWWLR